MNNRNVKLWVDALRSGLYKQGQKHLHSKMSDGNKFCCLGVACEVYQREVGDLVIDDSDFHRSYDGHTGTLPPKVLFWLGMHSYYGRLALMNDEGSSFEEIADAIESHLFD